MSYRFLALSVSIVALSVFLSNQAWAQGGCLTLNWNGFESNPDSILVDTCLTLPGSSHAVFWVKGRYEIFFDSNAIPLGYGAPDSDLEVEWQAIDTAFPLIRNGFKAIYDSIGPFSLKKRDPSDTGDIGSHGFYLIFQNYVPNDSVIARLNDISGLRFHLVYHPALMSIPNDKGLLVGSTIDQILKTNPGDFVHRTFIVSVGNGISMPCAVRWRGKSLRAVIKQATRKS